MLGHSSIQMIFTKYYAWMPKKTRNDGAAFMKAYDSVDKDRENAEQEGQAGEGELPDLTQAKKRTYTK